MWCLGGGKSFPLSVLLVWLLLSAPAVQVAAFSRPQHRQQGFTGVGAQGRQGRLFQYQHIALAPSVVSPIATARRRSCIASAPDNNNHIPEEIKNRVMKALDGKEDLSVVSYVADFYKDSFVKKRIGALEDTVQQLVQRIQALEAKAATNQQLKPARPNQKQPRYQHLRLRPQQQQQQQQQPQSQDPQAEQTQQTHHTQQARNAWQEYLRSTLGTVPPQPRSQPLQPQKQQTQQITQQQNRFDEYAATSADNMGSSTSSQGDVDYSDEYSVNYGDEYEGDYEDEYEDDSEDEDSDEDDTYSFENNRQDDATNDSSTTRQRQSQQSPSASTEQRGQEEWAQSSRWPFTEFRNFFNRIVYL